MTGPRAIISPSVLASNFGNLTNEIKRMMGNGAEWVHMGLYSIQSSWIITNFNLELIDIMDGWGSFFLKLDFGELCGERDFN